MNGVIRTWKSATEINNNSVWSIGYNSFVVCMKTEILKTNMRTDRGKKDDETTKRYGK